MRGTTCLCASQLQSLRVDTAGYPCCRIAMLKMKLKKLVEALEDVRVSALPRAKDDQRRVPPCTH